MSDPDYEYEQEECEVDHDAIEGIAMCDECGWAG